MLGVQGWSQVHVALPLLVSDNKRRALLMLPQGWLEVTHASYIDLHCGSDTCTRGVAVSQRGVTINDEEE